MMHLPAPPAPQVACLPCDVSVLTISFKSPRYFIVLGFVCVRAGGEGPKRRGRKPKSEKLLLLQQQEHQGSGSDM